MPASEHDSHERSRSSSPVGENPRRQSSSLTSATVVVPSTESEPNRRRFARKKYDYIMQRLLLRATRYAVLLYGLFCFCLFATRALIEGCVLKKPGNQFWAELVSERSRLWDLGRCPCHDLKHAFYSLEQGRQLHYLTNNFNIVRDSGLDTVDAGPEKRPNLIIFIHGWPDSCMLWQDVFGRLQLPLKEKTTIVSVDLPGFGGSDSLVKYSPGPMVGSLFEFILAMRTLYLKEGAEGKVVIVAHDWGALCGFQLAASAPQLADRFILCNSILPHLIRENIAERQYTASKLYSEWRRDFSGKMLPTRAIKPLIPLFRQLWLSAYIFIFNLPVPLARASISRCNLWAMRFISSMAVGYGTIMHTPKVVSAIASSLGPNILTCDTETPDGEGYGDSVHFRAREDVSTETLRLYREGLGSRVWRRREHHAQTLHALDLHNYTDRGKKLIGALDPWPPGKLNAPATIVWGERDPALDARLALEGIDAYLQPNSQVIRLPKVGHWIPLEGEGPAVLAAVIEWAVDESQAENIVSKVWDVCVTAKFSLMK